MAVNGRSDAAVPGGLDWRVVGRAALVAIAVTVPVTVVVRILSGDDMGSEGSSVWVVAVVALFAGFAVAGDVAARRRPDAPLVHAAAAAGLAFGVLTFATVVRRLVAGDGVSVPLVITLGLLLQISVSLAMLGAYVGGRRRSRGNTGE